MKTVLLWDEAWWLPAGATPVEFTAATAADALAAAWPKDEPRTLRLVYQPRGFTTQAVTCPHGGRELLALALGEQFPALLEPGYAWSVEPILATAEGHSTLLHCEARPEVDELLRRLESLGFHVSSVLPVSTWLQFLPTEWSETGAFAVLLIGTDAGIGYTYAASGAREVPVWSGGAVPAKAANWLRQFLAKNPGASVLVVVTEPSHATDFDAISRIESPPVLDVIALGDALERAAVVPGKHPAQLLRPKSWITPVRAAAAASVLFLGVTAVYGLSYVRHYAAVQKSAEAKRTERIELGANIKKLRQNAAEIEVLSRNVSELTPPPVGLLLRELTQGLPREVVWTRLQVADRSFELRGVIPPGAKGAILDSWFARCGAKERPWRIEKSVLTDGKFQLRGAFLG